ncbi:S1 family peptidase [Corynebacterium sp. ES2794-CONJ1]|uniref:S1 family peptidase n=1 Tax=unclassified Corynebacterium TaxID=2624378 RepID=UPI0021676CEE|nr:MULTISPECIES: S1 family peptidase [unclassified Corynebacterium]MCS4489732.1 S1 family peptidase [Corynebacterium sp. ES2775-CONJ]MCS4531644.1 S1 family peptidase [Corynebacterium sp. ES2730-CONJ]MCU9519040.1 S1 family peptidase [Corynebacterium sp. ES2794-CONJ1]
MKKSIVALGLAASLLGHVPVAHALVGGVEVSSDDPIAQAVVQVGVCTGTIIHPHWVLTARHCAHSSTVHHGLNRPFKDDPQARQYLVDSATVPEFGDIALLHISENMAVPTYPGLYPKQAQFRDLGITYGWGGGTLHRLKKADIAVKRLRMDPAGFGGSTIEVQYLNDASPRRGDSGGPLVIDGAVAGVTSSSFKASAGFADYAELHPHLKWVEDIIKSHEGPDSVPQTEDPYAPHSTAPSAHPTVPTTHPEIPTAPPKKPTTQPNTPTTQPKPPSSPQPKAPSTPGMIAGIIAGILGVLGVIFGIVRGLFRLP